MSDEPTARNGHILRCRSGSSRRGTVGEMFVAGRASLEQLERILASQVGEALTYGQVGATRGVMPHGYRQDRHEIVLGVGGGVFNRAVEGLRRWEAGAGRHTEGRV